MILVVVFYVDPYFWRYDPLGEILSNPFFGLFLYFLVRPTVMLMDTLTGSYQATSAAFVPASNDAAALADTMTSKLVRNDHVQRYATKEEMRFCCNLFLREFLRRH